MVTQDYASLQRKVLTSRPKTRSYMTMALRSLACFGVKYVTVTLYIYCCICYPVVVISMHHLGWKRDEYVFHSPMCASEHIKQYIIRSHIKWGTYMCFDWLEAVATTLVGSKMCNWIFVRDLAPSILQRSRWYFAHTYLGWSRIAVQKLGSKCLKFREMVAILNRKNHIFPLFPEPILVIPTK